MELVCWIGLFAGFTESGSLALTEEVQDDVNEKFILNEDFSSAFSRFQIFQYAGGFLDLPLDGMAGEDFFDVGQIELKDCAFGFENNRGHRDSFLVLGGGQDGITTGGKEWPRPLYEKCI